MKIYQKKLDKFMLTSNPEDYKDRKGIRWYCKYVRRIMADPRINMDKLKPKDIKDVTMICLTTMKLQQQIKWIDHK